MGERDLAILDDGDRNAWDAELFAELFDPLLEPVWRGSARGRRTDHQCEPTQRAMDVLQHGLTPGVDQIGT